MEPRSFRFVSSARHLYLSPAIYSILFSDRVSITFGAMGHSGGLTACSAWCDCQFKKKPPGLSSCPNVHVSSPGKRFALSSPHFWWSLSLFQTYLFIVFTHYFVRAPHIIVRLVGVLFLLPEPMQQRSDCRGLKYSPSGFATYSGSDILKIAESRWVYTANSPTQFYTRKTVHSIAQLFFGSAST